MGPGVSLNLTGIKTALADQIQARLDTASTPATVRPFRTPSATLPCVVMTITDITYFGTFGPSGQAQILLDVTAITNAADRDSAEIAMCELLSVGTGNSSSIADAINSDVTLGGVVESCVCLEVGAPRDTDRGYEATFPLKILTRKVGAEV